MDTEPTPDTDTPAEPQVPFHVYESRIINDSRGRQIEFRQLVPGSADPGKEHFHELIGMTTITIRAQLVPGMPPDEQALPVPFNIPMGEGGGVPDIMAAFKVFDILADKAREEARTKLEAMISSRKKALGSKIVVPGRDVPMPIGLVK